MPFKSIPPPFIASNYERNANRMPDFCYFTKAKSSVERKWSKRRGRTREKKSQGRSRQIMGEERKKDVSALMFYDSGSRRGMMMSMDVLIIRINQGADA